MQQLNTHVAKSRRYDIDWLRIFAVLMLIYFHTARLFNHEDWYIKNVQLSSGLDVLVEFIGQWHMPLFFLVSGTATWFALGHRTGRQYASERANRLLVPLFFGIFVIVPPQSFFHYQNSSQSFDSYLSFYRQFLEWVRTFQAEDYRLEWGHLWFLAYLYVFSMIILPIFLYFRSASGKNLIARIAGVIERRPSFVFLLSLPFIITEILLRWKWPGENNLIADWASFTFYIIIFFYGFLLVSDSRFEEAIAERWRTSLILAIIFSGLQFLPDEASTLITENEPALYVIDRITGSLTTWFWLVAFLGFGRKFLSFTNGFLKYASEAALPFYILHQTVIISIAYPILKLDLGVPVKFLIISTASIISCIAIYDLLIKRIGLLRFLFGMRPQRR